MTRWLRILLFAALLVFCAAPWASPPIALALGLVLALSIGNPFATQTPKPTKILLQASVVGLGFGMNLEKVVEAGRTGILFTLRRRRRGEIRRRRAARTPRRSN